MNYPDDKNMPPKENAKEDLNKPSQPIKQENYEEHEDEDDEDADDFEDEDDDILADDDFDEEAAAKD